MTGRAGCLHLEAARIFVAVGLRTKYYFIRSPKTVICFFVFLKFSQASHLASTSLLFLLHNLKSCCPSLCSCFLPSSLSQAFLASHFSLLYTSSQDKQPLFWGMSAICSKNLTSFWMLFRAGSPKGGTITNLVLFHNISLCFSFFLVCAALFSNRPTLSRLISLLWNLVIPGFVSFVALSHLCLTSCSKPVWPYRVFRFLCCLLNTDLFSIRAFQHSSLTYTWGKNWIWEHQFSCLWAACVKSFWEPLT